MKLYPWLTAHTLRWRRRGWPSVHRCWWKCIWFISLHTPSCLPCTPFLHCNLHMSSWLCRSKGRAPDRQCMIVHRRMAYLHHSFQPRGYQFELTQWDWVRRWKFIYFPLAGTSSCFRCRRSLLVDPSTSYCRHWSTSLLGNWCRQCHRRRVWNCRILHDYGFSSFHPGSPAVQREHLRGVCRWSSHSRLRRWACSSPQGHIGWPLHRRFGWFSIRDKMNSWYPSTWAIHNWRIICHWRRVSLRGRRSMRLRSRGRGHP